MSEHVLSDPLRWEVHDSDSAAHAAHLVRRTVLADGVHAGFRKPVLRGDNGATLTATTVLAMLNGLGIEPDYSRPCVADDNAYAESLFRTAVAEIRVRSQ